MMKDLTEDELAECADPGDGSCEHLITARMAAEIRRDRAMKERLREMALSLEHAYHPDLRKIGAELRARINGV